MQRAVLVESAGAAEEYSEQLSDEMLKLFAANGFRGALQGLGHNSKAPLLLGTMCVQTMTLLGMLDECMELTEVRRHNQNKLSL